MSLSALTYTCAYTENPHLPECASDTNELYAKETHRNIAVYVQGSTVLWYLICAVLWLQCARVIE